MYMNMMKYFQISPRAEIITSPIPEAINVSGGKQVIMRSPVPVLMNTSNIEMCHSMDSFTILKMF